MTTSATPKPLAIYGGSFCPPTEQHRAVAKLVTREFDGQMVVIPCGPRPDKPELTDIPTVHRAAMADLAFGDLGITVELSDLEQASFTRSEELENRYSNNGENEVWHVVGPDLVRGGATGDSLIQRSWQNGRELWKRLRFVVMTYRGFPVMDDDLPPTSRVYHVDVAGSATMLRQLLRSGVGTDGYLTRPVHDYIRRHELFSDKRPSRTRRTEYFMPRPITVVSRRSDQAKQIQSQLGLTKDSDDPNCIVVIGGDGTMLRAIQMHWRRRLPFIGINAGHLGFLLNPINAFPSAATLSGCAKEGHGLVTLHAPMIYVEWTNGKKGSRSDVAFNDAWIERSTGQTAWMKVTVSGGVKMQMLISDGLLVATAAGSTAYAMSMGASPLLADTPAWLVVGSNVQTPLGWKSAMLTLDDTIDVEVLDPVKRPMIGFMYGRAMGEVRSLHARISRVAAVELAYVPTHDLAQKIKDLQFGIIPVQNKPGVVIPPTPVTK